MRKGSSRDAESQILVTDLLRREGQTPTAERRPKTALRVLGAAAGVAVLCGTVGLGIAYMSFEDGPKTPAAAQQNFSGIVGGKALSPNAINAQTGQETGAEQPGGGDQPGGQGGNGTQGGNGGQGGQGRGGNGGGQGGDGNTGNGGGGGEQPGTGGGGTGGGGTGGGGANPQPTGGQTSQPGTTTSNAAKPTSSAPRPTSAAPTSSKSGGLLDPILDPILGLLTKAPSQPEQAYAMLAPEMRTGGVEEFKADWAGVESATVAESRPDGADAAVVTVDYRWKDGRTLRVEQRMTVDKVQRKITNAKVLSSKGR
ncbi:hypothetical protein N8J89_37890 [Crossiella sp. CA-258035]|uniref:hypothetical protein n=1 Tax=Crossiella sp. CA-258035 TaxID=2981138 RepID=UPI0024BC3665|nr:hypothetical protein [Crossiella sp. CA-258035]WHT18816.1 hypothetical protein N8J89_37890 [Crossiella sp. CA-258035]